MNDPSAIDHTRFAYLAAHERQSLELTGRQVAKITGLSTRQVSRAENGAPISAGATYLLAAFYGIKVDTLFSELAADRLKNIRKIRAQFTDNLGGNVSQKQDVTPNVSRGTGDENVNPMSCYGGGLL